MHYAPTTKPLIKRTCTKPVRKRLQFLVKVNHLLCSGYLVNSFGQGWSAFVIHFQRSVRTLRSVSRLFHVHSSCCTILYIAFSTSSLKDAIKKSSPVVQGDSSSWTPSSSSRRMAISISAIGLEIKKQRQLITNSLYQSGWLAHYLATSLKVFFVF